MFVIPFLIKELVNKIVLSGRYFHNGLYMRNITLSKIIYRILALIIGGLGLFFLVTNEYSSGEWFSLVSMGIIAPLFILYAVFGPSFFKTVPIFKHLVKSIEDDLDK